MLKGFMISLIFLALSASAASVGSASVEPKLIFSALLKVMSIDDVDVDTCFDDTASTQSDFQNFARDIKTKQGKAAVSDLNKALSSFSTSINDCGVQEIQDKIDAVSTAIHFSEISYVDDVINIIIDATDVSQHITKLALDIESADVNAIAEDINTIVEDWSKFVDCDSQTCQFIDNLFKILQVVAKDVSGSCLADLESSVSTFEAAVSLFNEKNITGAVAGLAEGFDELALVLANDECQITRLGELIGTLSEKLSEAIISADSIVINGAEIYDDIYKMVTALEAKDYKAFGLYTGKLVTAIQKAGCKSVACEIFIGILESAQLVATDYAQCISAVDATGADFETAIGKFESKDIAGGVSSLASAVKDLADDIDACDVEKAGQIIEDMASALGADGVVKVVGEVVIILTEGRDITNDIDVAIKDYKAGNMKAFGKDLGDIAHWLSDEVACHSFVCEIVEGILEEADIVLTHLPECEADLKTAEDDFIAGWTAFKTGDKKAGVEDIAKGIRVIGDAVGDCGLTDELAFFKHEADIFGMSNVTALEKAGEAIAVLIHGFDLFDDVMDMIADVQNHDYKGAGSEIKKIMDSLSEWSTGHVCQNTWCYIVEGVMEFEAVIEGDVRQCEQDFENAWGEFGAAVALFENQVELAKAHEVDMRRRLDAGFQLTEEDEELKLQISSKVKDAVKDIGKGLEDVAAGIHDCHLEELADILTKLAAELAVPEVSWIAEVLHIIVNGAEIVEDVGEACEAFGDERWASFGYDIAKLIKIVLL